MWGRVGHGLDVPRRESASGRGAAHEGTIGATEPASVNGRVAGSVVTTYAHSQSVKYREWPRSAMFVSVSATSA